MVREFDREQELGNPYIGKDVRPDRRSDVLTLIRDALENGTDESLIQSLNRADLWNSHGIPRPYKGGKIVAPRLNVRQAAERLGLTEFNTWYVRGLCCRFGDEGVTHCQVYRGGDPKWAPAECSVHEGQTYMVQLVLDGHRACYWPEPGTPGAVSVPFGPGCHHTIRRV